jgi:hypothetical protein
MGKGGGVHSGGHRAGPITIDFNRDGALQEVDGNNQPKDFIRAGYNAFEAGQRASFHVDARPNAKEGPRLGSETGTDYCADGFKLLLGDGEGSFSGADDADNAGSSQNGDETVVGVEAAKKIAGEKREIDALHPVCPAAMPGVERKKLLVTFAAQCR